MEISAFLDVFLFLFLLRMCSFYLLLDIMTVFLQTATNTYCHVSFIIYYVLKFQIPNTYIKLLRAPKLVIVSMRPCDGHSGYLY